MVLVLVFLIAVASIVAIEAMGCSAAGVGRRESRRYPVDENIDLDYRDQQDDFEDKL